jgi:two-component system chemotaxis response regulator CheY
MKTCLIVDDSRVIRKVARQIFEALGFSCEEAEHGQQALEACQKAMPKVILLDWNMPVMDGMEFLRALRKMPMRRIVVVFCTTENDMKIYRRRWPSGERIYYEAFLTRHCSQQRSQLGAIEYRLKKAYM